MNQQALIEWASVHQTDNYSPGDAGYVPAQEAIWSLEELPTQALLHLMPGHHAWVGWFNDQIAIGHERSSGWRALTIEPIREEIIVTLIDDRAYIWDGWHRAAATIIAGRDSISALVGRPMDVPMLRPQMKM